MSPPLTLYPTIIHRIFYQGVEFVLNRQAKSPKVPMVILVSGPPSLLTE